jgi:hypothetical protein
LCIKLHKRHTILSKYIVNDPRFSNAKYFTTELDIPVAVSESGYIAIIDYYIGGNKIIDIRDVFDIELQVNENSKKINSIGLNIGGLFGSSGKIEEKVNSIKVILKINDFTESFVEIPFLQYEIDKSSKKYLNIQNEVTNLISTLEYLKNKYKE